MRKIAVFIVLFMAIGQVYGFCYPATVDNVLDTKSKSELHPVQDAAKMAGAVNSGVNKAIEKQPMSTIMKPIETVRKGTLKGAYKVTNTLWDFLTFRWMRSKDKPKA